MNKYETIYEIRGGGKVESCIKEAHDRLWGDEALHNRDLTGSERLGEDITTAVFALDDLARKVAGDDILVGRILLDTTGLGSVRADDGSLPDPNDKYQNG